MFRNRLKMNRASWHIETEAGVGESETVEPPFVFSVYLRLLNFVYPPNYAFFTTGHNVEICSSVVPIIKADLAHGCVNFAGGP